MLPRSPISTDSSRPSMNRRAALPWSPCIWANDARLYSDAYVLTRSPSSRPSVNACSVSCSARCESPRLSCIAAAYESCMAADHLSPTRRQRSIP